MKNFSKIEDNFYNDGFVVVRNILSKASIRNIQKEIVKVKKISIKIKNPHLHLTQDNKINTVHDINKYLKKGRIIQVSKDKKILNIIKNLLKANPKVRNIEFFSKPKKTGLKSPHHQDNYYWKFEDKRALNVWIACDKSSKSNGGVFYLKGSHKSGLKKHVTSYAPGSSYKIPLHVIRKLKFEKIYPKLNPGDMLIHHCEVIHGSHENKSNKNRQGLVISYKANNSKPNPKLLKDYKLNVKKNINFLSNNR